MPTYSPTASYGIARTTPPRLPAPRAAVPRTAAVPQGQTFGGTVGPYVGTLPAGTTHLGGNLPAPTYNPTVTGGGVTYPTDAINRPGAPPATNPYGPDRPDLAALIGGDYEVQQAQTDAATRMAQMQGQFGQNIRQSLIDLGLGDTSKLGQFGQYIDSGTLQNAIANKYSAYSQIQQGQDIQNAQTAAALAARGGLSSGEYTNQLAATGQSAEQSRYNALQQFLNAGQQGLGNLADQQNYAAQAIAQARANAAQRAAQYQLGWLNWQGQQPQDQGGGAGSVPAYNPPPPGSTPNVATANPPANPANAFQQMPGGYYDLIRHMWVSQ